MVSATQMNRPALADEQYRAVHAPIGPTLVPAGPGSGKTTVTIRRVAWMIQDMNIDAATIAVFTFTNRAARELRSRLSEELRDTDTEGLFAGTFHSWGARFLSRYAALADLEAPFSIYDQDDSIEAVQEAMRAAEDPRANDQRGPRDQMRRISRWKNRGESIERLLAPWAARIELGERPAHASRLLSWQEYDRILQDNNAADFDDLIVMPLKILTEHEDVLEEVQDGMRHILVDEYQDTSRSQHRLVTTLANRKDGGRASLFVVGDSDQAIYAFRNADIRNFNNFRDDGYPETRELHLAGC